MFVDRLLVRSKADNTILPEQLAAVIKSLDDLTERYEIENSILEEKIVESINEVSEVKHQVRYIRVIVQLVIIIR